MLACCRYIELNPARARIVALPEEFSWSSYRANALTRHGTLVSPHPSYCALASSADLRAAAYTTIVREVMCEADIKVIRAFLQQQRSLGSDLFQRVAEQKTRRFAGMRPVSRPCLRHHHLEIQPDPNGTYLTPST